MIFTQWAPTDAALNESNAKHSTIQWWKGNLHTHSLWSDGDDYPEMIVDWYKGHGYHFLALSDHNTLSQGEKWIDVAESRGGLEAYQKYLDRFGPRWVEQREVDNKLWARLKPLNEFRHRFEEPDRFLLIQGEEITDRFEKLPVHLNATNLMVWIPPQGGSSVFEVMQNNVNAVLAQRGETGQPMFPHVNHPNFGWAVTAEDIATLKGERFFEVYNGHPAVRNYGDAQHTSTERMWDIILTHRLAEPGGEVIYGIAVDDAHNYHIDGSDKSNPGRGWVMVRAAHLTPEAMIAAMEGGDFYASTGVDLEEIRWNGAQMGLKIRGEDSVSYITRFIGTRRGYDRHSEAVLIATEDQPHAVTRRYSDDVGEILAEVKGTSPTYTLTGDESYVRAKVISSKLKANPYAEGEMEVAWTQPFVPKTGRN